MEENTFIELFESQKKYAEGIKKSYEKSIAYLMSARKNFENGVLHYKNAICHFEKAISLLSTINSVKWGEK